MSLRVTRVRNRTRRAHPLERANGQSVLCLCRKHRTRHIPTHMVLVFQIQRAYSRALRRAARPQNLQRATNVRPRDFGDERENLRSALGFDGASFWVWRARFALCASLCGRRVVVAGRALGLLDAGAPPLPLAFAFTCNLEDEFCGLEVLFEGFFLYHFCLDER